MHNAKGKHELPLVEKLLPLWIVLCMAGGLLIGKFIDASKIELWPAVVALGQIFAGKFIFDLGHILSLGIPVGLFLMIYPAMAKIHMEDARKALTNGRAAGVVIFFNYLINPFLLWLFGWIFLRNYPQLWTGLVLLGVAPCIAMVLVWTDLSGGNNPLALTLMAWNSLIQMVTTPFFIFLIIGSRVPLDVGLIAESVILYLGLPLAAGVISRNRLIKRRGHEWFVNRFTPVINKVQFGALLFTLVIMFSLKGDVIIANPRLIPLMAVPLTLFFLVLYFITFRVGRWFKLPVTDAVAVAFNSTGRNFELSIAIALTAFATQPMVGVATVVGPLIEVPVMLFLVNRARKAIATAPEDKLTLGTQREVFEDDRL
jgi:ACR3 family arsenite transporter